MFQVAHSQFQVGTSSQESLETRLLATRRSQSVNQTSRHPAIMSKLEQDFQKASKEFQRLQAGKSTNLKFVHPMLVCC